MYADREDAGRKLAQFLNKYKGQEDTIVLGLPRGGVPVAAVIAKTLSLPLDIFLVRKLGLPGHEELAFGAIASGNTVFYNDAIVNQFNLKESQIQAVIEKEQSELLRRQKVYRGDKPFPKLETKHIILVDDGIATGASMHAAIDALHVLNPKSIVVAVPVAPPSSCEELAPLVTELVCPLQPPLFYAVGQWYTDFGQTSDKEVIDLLK